METLMDQASHKLLEALYGEMIVWRPASAAPHVNFGNLLSYEKKPDEPAAEFRTAIRLDPTDAVPHNNLGVVLHNQKNLDEGGCRIPYGNSTRFERRGAVRRSRLRLV